MKFWKLASMTMVMAFSASVNASTIYNIDETIGIAQIGGTITTDGTIGDITFGNILDWDLLLDDGVNSVNLSSSTSFIDTGSQHGFISTGAELSFDHSIGTGSADYFLFYVSDFSTYWCLEGINDGCSGNPGTSNISIDGSGYVSSTLGINVIGTSAVPVPAAAWLFGSGLIGLVGIARRKQG